VTVRVLVADDQAPFRRAARSVVGATADFELVGEAGSGEEAVALVGLLRPDLVLMDIAMDGIGGIEAARSIASTFPGTLTILLSTYREEELPARAATCGAAAYVHKSEFSARVLCELWGSRLTRSRRDRG
jgi:two-component system, NarL family, invasion response regulator UvrY